jgi:small-conductance mechanosensitive channel
MNVDARIRIVLAASLALTIAGARPAPGAPAATDSLSRTSAAAAESAAATPGAPATPATPAEPDTGQGMLPTPEEAATPETVATPPKPAPVFLGGKELFRVRAARNGMNPNARAVAIRSRLEAAVLDVDTSADSVRLVRTTDGIEVRLGDHYLWTITRDDIQGMGVAAAAHAIGELPARVTAGILKERAARRPLGILTAALIALGITILAVVVGRLLLVASRRWSAFLKRTLPRYLGGIRVGGYEVLSQNQLTGTAGGVLARLDVIAWLLLLYGYLTALFSLFPWSQGWSWRLLEFARMELMLGLTAIGLAIPGLLVIALIVAVTQWVIGVSDRFFDAIEAGTVTVGWMHQELGRPTKKLVRILLWVVAAMIAYPFIPGSDSKAVQGISLLLGVMVSLGSSNFIGNAVAGMALTYARAFSIGDRVKIGEHIGTIVSLGFFATKLRTVWNEEVTLPNGQVASQPIVNFTRLAAGPGLLLHTQVSLGYDEDWRIVHRLLLEAAGRVEGIEPEPEPFVLQRALNDYTISYELNCMTRRSHEMRPLYSRLHEEIQDAFARAGVEILSPAYVALRDANAPVLPQEPPGPRPEPGGFRVKPPGA